MFKLTFVALSLVSLAILQSIQPSYAKKGKPGGILKQVKIKTICPNPKKNLNKVLSIVSAVDLTLRYTHGKIGLLEMMAKQLKIANKKLMKRLAVMDRKLNDISNMIRKAINKDKPQPKTLTICEGKRAALKCRRGRKLLILRANYGRLNKRTCNSGPIRTTSCTMAAKSLALVRRACHGKASCLLSANNSVFGDPCGGTCKYLQVKYRCQN